MEGMIPITDGNKAGQSTKAYDLVVRHVGSHKKFFNNSS